MVACCCNRAGAKRRSGLRGIGIGEMYAISLSGNLEPGSVKGIGNDLLRKIVLFCAFGRYIQGRAGALNVRRRLPGAWCEASVAPAWPQRAMGLP